MTLIPVKECRSAEQVFAAAKEIYEKRVKSREKQVIVRKDTSEECPERIYIYPIMREIARQLAIETKILKGGEENGKTIPLAQYRQFAAALALQLSKRSLPAVARAFNLDHTTVIHAREVMSFIINAPGMRDKKSIPELVAACLPLLFTYIEGLRRTSRERVSGSGGPFKAKGIVPQ